MKKIYNAMENVLDKQSYENDKRDQNYDQIIPTYINPNTKEITVPSKNIAEVCQP